MDVRKNAFSARESLKLKGVAIILMMFFHCLSTKKRMGGYPVEFAPLTEATALRLFAYFKICVTIFAFITGYGLYLSYRACAHDDRTRTKWVATRYVKTFSGFTFVYVLVVLVLAACTTRLQHTYLVDGRLCAPLYMLLDACGLARMFGTPTIMSGWWYMSAVVVFIALVPLFCEVDRRVGMLPIIVLVVAIPRVLKLGFLGASQTYTFIPAVVMGMLFAKHDVFFRLSHVRLVSNTRIDAILQFVAYALLLAICIRLFQKLDKREVWEYHYAISAIGCILFSWKYLMPLPGVGNALEFLGKHSMNIYYIHTFIRRYGMGVVYASGSMLLIPLTLLAFALVCSLGIEACKKAVHFDRLQAKVLARLTSA